jgi:hypothetical protein
MAAICREKLIVAGYSPGANNTSEDDLLDYLRVARRRIEARARSVHVAAGLTCPENLQAGFEAIKAAASAGQSLRPYQSKRVADADYEDSLLNAWDVHHFHLGTTITGGWAARTGPLLFARLTERDLYCIAVLPHGSWTQQQLIATLHDNWPETIEMFRMKGVDGLAHQVSDDDLKALRKANINSATEVAPGVVYMTPGLGAMLDGTSTWAMMSKLTLKRMCAELERQVRVSLSDPGSSISSALTANGIDPAYADFTLMFDGTNALLRERSTHVALNIGPQFAVPPID